MSAVLRCAETAASICDLDDWVSGLSQIRWVALRFTATSRQSFVLQNPWSDLHGGFGMMLKRVAPETWDVFFGERERGGDVRPYVLKPCDDALLAISAGTAFSFDLILIGDAIAHSGNCIRTLVALGEQGLTPVRYKFDLQCLSRLNPDQSLTPVTDSTSLSLASSIDHDPIKLSLDSSVDKTAIITMTSPLRLKHLDRTIESAPVASIFFNRLISRLKFLSVQQTGTTLMSASEHSTLLEMSKRIELANDLTQFIKVSRWSSRQMARMEMMGVIGQFCYAGIPAPLLVLLSLGQWIHIGSNTTFGFGSYRFELSSHPNLMRCIHHPEILPEIF